MNERPLTGKVSVVTGSGRRTGRIIAQQLAAAGCKVALVSRSERELKSVAEEIRDEGGEVLVLPTDVTSEKETQEMVANTLDAYGQIDHLINAAGVYLTGPIDHFSLEDWNKTLSTYLTAPFLCCKAVAEPMRKAKSGHILNISSMLVSMAPPGFEAYCGAKGGLEAFSRSIANSLQVDGIKVSVLVPGAINAAEHEPDLEKMLEPIDVADAVLYMLQLPDHVYVPELILRTMQ